MSFASHHQVTQRALPGQFGALWTPNASNTQMWLDASDTTKIIESSGAVSEWRDKSGKGRHVKQTVAADKPTTGTTTINGLNAIVFDGTTEYLQTDNTATWLNNRAYSIFAVTKFDTTTKAQDYICGTLDTGTNKGLHIGWRNASDWTIAQFSNDANFAATRTTNTTLTTSRFLNNGGRFALNGTVLGVDNSIPTAPLVTTGKFSVGVGINLGAGRYFTGVMCELIIITGTLSNEDKFKTEGYLAHKWGTLSSLSASHPYKVNAPIVG